MPAAAKDAVQAFRALHAGPELLILPNCWDAVSARVLAEAGASAMATSSAAVAWTHGYADGDKLPVACLVSTLEAITRSLPVPLTADIEGGYTDNTDDLCEFMRWVIGSGVVGVNLEDRAAGPSQFCGKLEAVRWAAEAEGVQLFINARTDVVLKKTHAGEAAVAEVLRRATLYRSAGADGLFVPAVVEEAEIAAIAAGTPLPLNVMVWPGLPPGARLQALGVRRISSATWPARVALNALRDAAAAYLATGDAAPMIEAAGPSVNFNALFSS